MHKRTLRPRRQAWTSEVTIEGDAVKCVQVHLEKSKIVLKCVVREEWDVGYFSHCGVEEEGKATKLYTFLHQDERKAIKWCEQWIFETEALIAYTR